MPIFEYQCKACGHCFEQLMFAGDRDKHPPCPECGSDNVSKLMSCINALGGDKVNLCSSGSSGFS
jgi:putative FmdB family regulatory protein